MSNFYYDAWQKSEHARTFDKWSRFTLSELKCLYESFNEIQLLKEYGQCGMHNRSIVEVGCATGELYRYLKNFYPNLKYSGLDISQTAIKRAQEKYPQARFFVCRQDLSDINTNLLEQPDIVFSRDVVLHQTDPYGFMAQLFPIPKEAVVLRLRTRDKGATVLDPAQSCQWNFNQWVPFIILNTDELIEFIKKTANVHTLVVLKSHQPLGGFNSRFLSKDCYYPETGTAETAVYIGLSREKNHNPKIIVCDQVDSNPNYGFLEMVSKGIRKITDRMLVKV